MSKHVHELTDWEPFAGEISALLKKHGFYILASSVEKLEAADHEVESALRVVLLHRQIPYLPLSICGSVSDIDHYMNSFGVIREYSHSHDEIIEFEKALPDGVQLLQVHWLEYSWHRGPGWVGVVQTHQYGHILEEFFKIPGRARSSAG